MQDARREKDKRVAYKMLFGKP